MIAQNNFVPKYQLCPYILKNVRDSKPQILFLDKNFWKTKNFSTD